MNIRHVWNRGQVEKWKKLRKVMTPPQDDDLKTERGLELLVNDRNTESMKVPSTLKAAVGQLIAKRKVEIRERRSESKGVKIPLPTEGDILIEAWNIAVSYGWKSLSDSPIMSPPSGVQTNVSDTLANGTATDYPSHQQGGAEQLSLHAILTEFREFKAAIIEKLPALNAATDRAKRPAHAAKRSGRRTGS